MTGTVTSVLHPVVIAADMATALGFYRDLLGLAAGPVMRHDPVRLARLGGPQGAVAQAVILHAPDGSEIELACFTEPRGRTRANGTWPDAGIRSITFVVDDIAAMLQRLGAGGHPAKGEVVPFATPDGPVRVAYVAAPDGVVMTLLERG